MDVVPGLEDARMGGRLLLLLLGLGSAAAADEDQQRAEKARARMAPIVERLLGAPFPEPVPVTVLDKDALARKREGLPKRAGHKAHRLLWVRLGLLPEREQKKPPSFTGVYARDEKRIYIVIDDTTWWHAGPLIRHTMAHELVHAHRHATGLYDKWPSTWCEAETAFKCLAEGDAQLWAAVAWIEDGGKKEAAAEAAERVALKHARIGLPSTSREGYASIALVRQAYARGAHFAARVHAHGGRDAIDAAFRDPPTTTEQILHPEKYLGPERDEPVRFGEADVGSVLVRHSATPPTLPADERRLPSEWTHALSGDLGELLLRVFFCRALGEERGPDVAEGWDGCRFQLYTREGRAPLLVLMSAWDTEHDAAVFAGAWCDWAGRRDGKPYDVHVKPGPAGAMRSVETEAGPVVTVRRGKEVMVVDGGEAEKRIDILRALWNAPRE
jgi:hypothetical protein